MFCHGLKHKCRWQSRRQTWSLFSRLLRYVSGTSFSRSEKKRQIFILILGMKIVDDQGNRISEISLHVWWKTHNVSHNFTDWFHMWPFWHVSNSIRFFAYHCIVLYLTASVCVYRGAGFLVGGSAVKLQTASVSSACKVPRPHGLGTLPPPNWGRI